MRRPIPATAIISLPPAGSPATSPTDPVILFLHHRYRVAGGEERAVEDLAWLVREHLGEDAELLARDSAALSGRGAAAGLLAGGLHPEAVGRAVRRTRARIVHAHNLHPTFGWRALAAAREAGARVVLHLHQYRLVCAIGVCFRDGEECTSCHGTDTLPGIVHNCRGSRAEALTYGAGLAVWQRRLAGQVDAFAVPSHAALARLHELGAPVGEAHVVPNVLRTFADAPPAIGDRDGGALVVSRLAPEKGLDVAVQACALAGVPLTVAGDGPELERLRGSGRARVLGRVAPPELAALRASSAVAVVPSRSAETFGLAAAEAMAAGLPVAASRIGALPELVPDEWLAPPGDAAALARVIARVAADPAAGARALALARARTAPSVVAPALRALYDAASS